MKSWIWAKVSIGAAGCLLAPPNFMTPDPWKTIKIYENPWKSMIINRKRWKSSDDKKPAWNRAKVSIGAAGRTLPSYTVLDTHARKSMKIHDENPWRSMIIDGKRWKSSDDKKPAWSRAKVSIRAAGRFLSSVSTHTPKFRKIMKIYKNLWKSSKIYDNQ